MKKYLLGGVFALIAFVVGGGVAIADVLNGSFEGGVNPSNPFNTLIAPNSNIDNWKVEEGSIDWIGNYWGNADGNWSIDMNGLSSGTISQEIDTVPDTLYRVVFYMSGNPDGRTYPGGPYTSDNNKELIVTTGEGSEQSYFYDTLSKNNTKNSMMWEENEYTFIATSETTKLSFSSGIDGAFGPALDNVSIEVVDGDGDGVYYPDDQCLLTNSESMTLNPNHFMWDGSNLFQMGLPKGKAKGVVDPKYTIGQTHGCNCEQILDKMGFDESDGQYQHGCSLGTMREFMSMYPSI